MYILDDSINFNPIHPIFLQKYTREGYAILVNAASTEFKKEYGDTRSICRQRLAHRAWQMGV